MGRGPISGRQVSEEIPTVWAGRLYTPDLHAVLIPVSRGYPPPEGRLSTRYSPVRRLTAETEIPTAPLDLHVLGTPPAFVLSQDQTLSKIPPFRVGSLLKEIRTRLSQALHPI
jgi:hypothetical protein